MAILWVAVSFPGRRACGNGRAASLCIHARSRVLVRMRRELLLGEELLLRPAVAVGLGEAVDLSEVR